MPAKNPKKKKTPQKKTAQLDLLHDHIIRSGMMGALALFTLILLLPLSPCRFMAGETQSWGMCGQFGWDSLSPGYKLTDLSILWFGGIDLTGPERGFIFAGIFGLLYMLYLKVYDCCITKGKCTCC